MLLFVLIIIIKLFDYLFQISWTMIFPKSSKSDFSFTSINLETETKRMQDKKKNLKPQSKQQMSFLSCSQIAEWCIWKRELGSNSRGT